MDAKKCQEMLENELNKLKKDLKKPNILLAGATGVGKSSLVNQIFGEKIAKAGTGKPVTSTIDIYENNEVSVILYDSRGYELGSEEQLSFIKDVIGLVDENMAIPEKQIHLVWYCINAGGHRITDYDKSAIRQFKEKKMQVAVVFTKSELISDDDSKKMKSIINEFDKSVPIFETSSNKPANFINDRKQLINWSCACLPEQLKEAFIKSQRSNLSLKWEKAHSIVIQHCAAAFAVGFVPIPMADAPILVLNQMALIGRILNLYDLDSYKDIITGGVTGGIVGKLVSSLGKSIVASLLKFIPVVGWFIGGAISGTVATILTAALGEAVSGASYAICKAILEGNNDKAKELIETFGNTISIAAKNYFESKKSADSYTEPK